MTINTLRHIPFLKFVNLLLLCGSLGNMAVFAQKKVNTPRKEEPTSQDLGFKGTYHLITDSQLTPIEALMFEADFCQMDRDYMLVPNCETEFNEDGTIPTDEYSIRYVKSALMLDVIEWYNLQSKYDSPLKLKRFKESDEYKRMKADLEVEKNCILSHTYYAIFDFSSQYDLDDQSFAIPLSPNFFDCAYVANGVVLQTKDSHFREGEFIAAIIDEDLAYQIETNDTQLVVFVNFTGECDHNGDLICEPSKVYITNKKTGEIYYKYTPNNSAESDDAPSDEDSEDERIVEVAETMPEYPGGDAAFFKFMASNLRYPAAAMKDNVQGRVVVSFVVDKYGKATDPKITRSLSSECDEEVKRLISIMPQWKPGTANGQPVNVRYTTVVNFRLQ